MSSYKGGRTCHARGEAGFSVDGRKIPLVPEWGLRGWKKRCTSVVFLGHRERKRARSPKERVAKRKKD